MSFLSSVLSQITVAATPLLSSLEGGRFAWRPPEWSQPALTAITVPGTSGTPDAQVYVFDAILRAEHRRELQKTEHPIQAAPSAPLATITDHAFLVPARVTLDIAMSDAMASFTDKLWATSDSKSVSAYQTLVSLQKERTLVTLTTRLDTYQNMIIESITPTETRETRHGLRATVALSEVFLAGLSDNHRSTASLRPQTTGATPSGVVQSLPVPASLTGQNNIVGAAANALSLTAAAIPGAGTWSSVNVSRLGGLLG